MEPDINTDSVSHQLTALEHQLHRLGNLVGRVHDKVVPPEPASKGDESAERTPLGLVEKVRSLGDYAYRLADRLEQVDNAL